MKIARQIAKTSSFKRHTRGALQLGCVVVYKHHIISSGVNSDKTHPLQKEYNKLRFVEDTNPHSLHAEIAALIPLQDLNIDWSKVSLFIYRIKKNESKHGLARPCASCLNFIKDLGIQNIYYTTDTGYIHEILDID